jgi:hypothetical protein
VAVLLREEEAERLALVSNYDRLDVRDRPRRGQLVEIEVGETPHDRLSLHLEASQGGGDIEGEEAFAHPLLHGGHLVVLTEEECAPWCDPDRLRALHAQFPDLAAHLDLPGARDVLDAYRGIGERSLQRRAPHRRRIGTGGREKREVAHERSLPPSGSKNGFMRTDAFS